MLFEQKPSNFNSRVSVVSCFCESKGKILLLKRQDGKHQGNTWGVPAGKVDKGEKPLDSLIREVWEETGIKLTRNKVTFIKKVYIRFIEFDFPYLIYHTVLDEKPEILIRGKEHKGYKWVLPKKALEMNLIEDLDKCIKLHYKV